MTASSAPPSPVCGPSMLLLQRRLSGRDCGKWRTVCRLTASQTAAAQTLAAAAIGIDAGTEWRIVADAPDATIVSVMHGDPRAWVPLEDHERVRKKKALMTECLVKIAQQMNKLADALEAEGSSINDETRPAPLGD